MLDYYFPEQSTNFFKHILLMIWEPIKNVSKIHVAELRYTSLEKVSFLLLRQKHIGNAFVHVFILKKT